MFDRIGVLPLPNRTRLWLGRLMEAGLQPGPGPAFDFHTPKGEPALVPADSVLWTVFKNPVTLFIGGVSAVLLELAEPRVRDGVWQNSSFRTDPLSRLRRTGLAANITVYGAASRAEAMIAGVRRMHEGVAGTTSEGLPYRASDPELLDWVQATASFGFLEAYSAYARQLSADQFSAAYRDSAVAARLYGATGAPRSRAEQRALFEAMAVHLRPSPVLFEFLGIMRRVPAFPSASQKLQRPLIRAAVELLPPRVRHLLGLGPRWSLRPLERPLVRLLAGTADRIVIPASPAVQSCRRLGLPDDFLYSSGTTRT